MGAQIERFALLVAGQTSELIERLDDKLLSDTLIARLNQPLLIFSHEEDYLATPETVEVLYERAAGPKQIVRFPGLGHATSQFVKTDVYIYYLDTFLAGIWAPQEASASGAP
jgi:pimeloyl-ACP methyl ester carboxylesterase